MKSSLNILIKTHRGTVHSTLLSLYRQAKYSDFVQKVAETFATRVLLIGIGLVTSVIVARILGPEGRGLYAVAVAIGGIGVQFGNLGLHASNTYYVAKDHSLLPTLLGNTLLVSFGFGGVGTLAAWLVFKLWPGLAPVNGVLLHLALLWVPFGLAYLLLQNLLLGIHEVRTYNTIELATKILMISFVGAIIIGRIVTVETVFIAGLTGLIISFVWALGRLLPYLDHAPIPSFTILKNGISYGLKAYLAAFFAFLVLRVDLLMVKQMLGAQQAGYYSIAASMADMVNMLPLVIATILFPKLSARPNTKVKWELTQKVLPVIGLGMVILVGLATLLAKPVVGLLYGEEFLPAVSAFIWLMPGILFLGIQVVAVQFLNSIGIPEIVVGIWGGAALFNLALNLWVIPDYGIVGAAIVSSLSYLIVCMLIMLVIFREVIRDR